MRQTALQQVHGRLTTTSIQKSRLRDWKLVSFHDPSSYSLDINKEPSIFLVTIYANYNALYFFPKLCSLNNNEERSMVLVMMLTSIFSMEQSMFLVMMLKSIFLDIKYFLIIMFFLCSLNVASILTRNGQCLSLWS